MQLNVFKIMYENNNFSKDEIEKAINYLNEADKYLKDIDNCTLEDIKKYVSYLVEINENSKERLITLARYFKLTKRHNIYIYFTSIFGGVGVIENIQNRIIKYKDKETEEEIFKNIEKPPLGASASEKFNFTKNLINKINSNIEKTESAQILAGNNHRIPKEIFEKEREIYKKIGNLDDYLKNLHNRKVEILQKHYDENQVWFEQEVNNEMINFVKSNQEILSAIRNDNYLYVTKIPYNTKAFLESKNELDKRYYACHCPFVREGIKENKKLDSHWCYCSAGFAKYPFEIIFDQELEVEMIESAIKGDLLCRFKIKLPDNY